MQLLDRVERTDEEHWGVGVVLGIFDGEVRVRFGGPVVAWVAIEDLVQVEDGESTPELIPGTMEALSGLTIRKETES